MRTVEYTGIKPEHAISAQPVPPEVFWDMYILAQGRHMPLLHVPTWFVLELRGADTPGSPRSDAAGATDEDLFILDWLEELGVKFCGFRGELSFDIPRRWAAFRPVPPHDTSLVAVDPLCIFPRPAQIATVEQSAFSSSGQAPVVGSWPVPSLDDVLKTLHPEARRPHGASHVKDLDSFTARLQERDNVSKPTCGFSGATGGLVEGTHIISRSMGSPYMCALARRSAGGSPWPVDLVRYSIDGPYNGLLTVFNAPPFGVFLTPDHWRREKVVYGGMGPFNSSQLHWGWIKDAQRYTLHFLERDSFLQDRFRGGAAFCETGKDYKLVEEETEGGYRLKDPGSYPPLFVCDVAYAAAVVSRFRHDGFEALLNALRVQARDVFGFTPDGDESEELDSDDSSEERKVSRCDAADAGRTRGPARLPYAGFRISDVELCLSLVPRPAVDVSEMPSDYIPAFSRRGNDKDECLRTSIPDESSALEDTGRIDKAALRARLGNARQPLRDNLSDSDEE